MAIHARVFWHQIQFINGCNALPKIDLWPSFHSSFHDMNAFWVVLGCCELLLCKCTLSHFYSKIIIVFVTFIFNFKNINIWKKLGDYFFSLRFLDIGMHIFELSLEYCEIFNRKTWNARPFLHWHQLIRKPWSLARLGLVRYGTSTLGKWKNRYVLYYSFQLLYAEISFLEQRNIM